MANMAVTIEVNPTEMHELSGVGDALWYQVGTLDIFVNGKVTETRRPAVHNLAMQIAINNGYKAMHLRCVKCQRNAKRKQEIKNLKLQGF